VTESMLAKNDLFEFKNQVSTFRSTAYHWSGIWN